MNNTLNSKQNLGLLFDIIECPIIYVSSEGILYEANHLAIKILKLNPKTYIGSNFIDHCKKMKFSLNFFFDKKKSAKSNAIKETYSLTNKNTCTISWKKTILPTLKKSDTDIVIIGYDITPEQTAIDNYQDSIFFYENILSKLPTNVYWKDKNCIYMGCNDRLAKVMQLPSRHAIKGMTDFDFDWGPNAAESFIAFDKEVMQTGKSLTTEDVFKEANGKTVTVLTNKTPLINKNGETVGVLAISVDITDRKEMKELKVAKEKAEAANYIMTEFISNMGHMLMSPFSIISGIATMLLYGYSDKYLELKPLFEDLMQGCADWEKVYTQIIKATSLKEMELKLETFSINHELMNIVSIMEPSIGSKKLKLIFKPLKSENDDWIETDKLKFHLIIIEFISNAIKFTEKGKITVSVTKQEGWFIIQVIDTGIGIPSDKLEYIFGQYTMLSRAQKHGADFRGVGAGLFLTTQRARLLDAEISVASTLGKGSTFTLRIPEKPIKNS